MSCARTWAIRIASGKKVPRFFNAGLRRKAIYSVFINVLRFALAVLFLPIVIAVTSSFNTALLRLGDLHNTFLLGVAAYVLMHLFIFIPQAVYDFFQNMFSGFFQFFPRAATSVPLIFPGIPMLILGTLFVIVRINKTGDVIPYFVFFAGFSLAMHIVLTAKNLYDDDVVALKPHYFLTMSAVYFFNLIVVILMLDLNFSAISSSLFFRSLTGGARDIYLLIHQQFFAA